MVPISPSFSPSMVLAHWLPLVSVFSQLLIGPRESFLTADRARFTTLSRSLQDLDPNTISRLIALDSSILWSHVLRIILPGKGATIIFNPAQFCYTHCLINSLELYIPCSLFHGSFAPGPSCSRAILVLVSPLTWLSHTWLSRMPLSVKVTGG